MENPLVSIITPCYNGEEYVQRFLSSVLNQTYDNIEMIFINDGSTDNTEKIVLEYKNKFNDKGIELIYIYQKNKGQAAAINKGLKIFRGKYLTWPDSDDVLNYDNIKFKVNYLEHHQDCGMVLCKSRIIDNSSLKQIGILQRIPPVGKDTLFYDLIIENNVYFAPGGYMVRGSSFLDVNMDRQIYECAAGQNWQMLLPIAYKYKCGYLNEFLYDYMLRVDSHSRRETTEEDILKKSYNHEDTLTTVINEMKIADEKYYLMIIKEKYIRNKLIIAYQFKDIELLDMQYNILKINGWLNKSDKILYYRAQHNMFNILCKLLILAIRVFRRMKRIIK